MRGSQNQGPALSWDSGSQQRPQGGEGKQLLCRESGPPRMAPFKGPFRAPHWPRWVLPLSPASAPCSHPLLGLPHLLLGRLSRQGPSRIPLPLTVEGMMPGEVAMHIFSLAFSFLGALMAGPASPLGRDACGNRNWGQKLCPTWQVQLYPGRFGSCWCI